jgi:hypothetical protein
MAQTIKWTTPITIETIMSTDLNSLANNAGEVRGGASAQYETADSLIYGEFELYVTFGVSPSALSLVEMFFIRRIDGTNPEDYTRGASAAGNVSGFAGGFSVRAVTSAQRIILPRVELPPLDWITMLINKTGQTMAASGNTLKLRRYSEQSV